MRKKKILAFAMFAFTFASAAQAQDASKEGWFIRSGPIGVLFDSKADISVGGSTVPGASADTKDNLTLGLDVGYRFENNFSLTFTGGVPPKTTLTGTGPLDGATLGKTYYAPAVLAAQYHFSDLSPTFQPYVGAGINYTLFFSASDGAVADLKVKNAFAPVIQAGFEYDVSDKVGLFLDVKKIFLSTTATGTVGGLPAKADVDANPLLLSTGFVYRF